MPILSARAFKSLARKGEKPPTATQLRKELIARADAIGERKLRFTISTGAVDRESDVVVQAGWVLGPFLDNPVVLFSHDQYAYPVGRAVDVGLEDGNLKATVEFVPADIPEAGARAEAIYQLCKQGFLSATSVGFRPLDWEIPQGESARGDDWFPGVTYNRQELVEFSICTVPCNPEALIDPPAAVVAPGDALPLPGNPPPVVQDAAAVDALKAAQAAVLDAALRAEAACARALDAERAAKAAAASAALRRRIRDALAAA